MPNLSPIKLILTALKLKITQFRSLKNLLYTLVLKLLLHAMICTFSKDVRLPWQLQRAMAAEAEAAREARAKVIAAEGEMNASRALKEASDVISESQSALQLRYLQTLTAISAEKNSTIIFPLPLELMGKMLK